MGKSLIILAAAVSSIALATPASASLTLFQNFTGNIGVSTSGGGSTASGYSFSNNNIPVGATVLKAYLYQGGIGNSPQAITLNGSAVTFGASVPNATGCCGLFSARADVTSIISPILTAGSNTFAITEGGGNVDGVALVIVYNNPAAAVNTVAILDGFASVTGDTATVSFAKPFDPTAAGAFAEMRLGDNFSCCNQRSNVTVNGTLISAFAGNNDDGQGGTSNGQLFTIGDDNDPFTPASPDYSTDHERYNLLPYITNGDTKLTLDTSNPSADDNIFLSVFNFSGEGKVTTTPEPGVVALLGLGLAGLAAARRRRAA